MRAPVEIPLRYGEQQSSITAPAWLEYFTRQSQLLPVYANNAAAVTGGLHPGEFYRTGGDPDLVCQVH